MRFSLRTKILMLLAGTATGLAAVIFFSMSLLTARTVKETVHADSHAAGVVLAQSLHERAERLTDQCVLLAKQPILKAIVSTNDPASITDTAQTYQKQFDVTTVIITDRDGYVMGTTDAGTGVHTDVSHEAGIAAALGGASSWSGILMRQGKLMLAVSVPILINQYPLGTFTAYRAIDAGVARSLGNALGTDVAFARNEKVLEASLPLPVYLSTPQDAPRLLTLNGTQYFALSAPLPDTLPQDHISFIILRSYAKTMALYDRFRTALILVTGVTLLLALLAGVILERGLTRPLDGIVQAALTLQAGQWPEKFSVHRQDEIGVLQNVFNAMTASLREGQDRLLALIDTDPLTGLDNHRRFHERLAQEAIRNTHSGEPLSLLLLDLDHFAAYNQRHGHAAGDETLRAIARMLRDLLPDVAVLARYSGNGFAALLPQYGVDSAELLAEQVRKGVWDRENQQEPGSKKLSLSLGIAQFGMHTSEAEGLVLAAELALSLAKQLGRNKVCRFDSVPGADKDADPYLLHRFAKDESLATIQALAAAVDAKDPYTQGHSQRVSWYATDLALYLGMPEGIIDQVHTTGTLHDVGKIGVPDAILKKPDRLTDEEHAVIQTHPALGEIIVRKVPSLSYTLPGVRHHHERWDGKGYPDKLAGEAIPPIARLLAIADTYDAMTSDRPYRKGMAPDVALAEIERGGGTQFDPDLAPAFVAMMRARDEVAQAV